MLNRNIMIIMAILVSMTLFYSCDINEDPIPTIDDNQPPSSRISIASPNANTMWLTGQSNSITWVSENIIGNVIIELYRDNQLLALPSNPVTTENDGFFDWNTPHIYYPKEYNDQKIYTLKISSETDPEISVTSDEFIIFNNDIHRPLMEDDFETGDFPGLPRNWNLQDIGSPAEWGRASGSRISGIYSLFCAGTNQDGSINVDGNVEPNMLTVLYSPSFNLIGTRDARLRMTVDGYITDGCDFVIEIFNNETNGDSEIFRLTKKQSFTSEEIIVPLSNYDSIRNASLKIIFMSERNDYDCYGVYIDDIVVEAKLD